MSTKSPVDLRSELAELVKRKAEIAVSAHTILHTCNMKYRYTHLCYAYVVRYKFSAHFNCRFTLNINIDCVRASVRICSLLSCEISDLKGSSS